MNENPVIIHDYAESRKDFLARARHAGAATISVPAPIPDVPGAITDLAFLGNEEAETAILVTSGTHGAELPFGALVQRELFTRLPRQDLSKIFFIAAHALNAYGSVKGLRTDTDPFGTLNIDPVRNFSYEGPSIAVDRFYQRVIHQANVRTRLGRAWLAAGLLGAAAKMGTDAFRDTVIQGQCTDPVLPFYGGAQACHTRQMLDHIIHKYITGPGHARQVLWLDLHTGNGRRGETMAYMDGPPERDPALMHQVKEMIPAAQRLRDVFGSLTGGSVVQEWFKESNIAFTNLVVEQGTTRLPGFLRDFDNLLATVSESVMLGRARRGMASDQDLADMAARNRAAFAPEDAKWQESARTAATHLAEHLGPFFGWFAQHGQSPEFGAANLAI